MEERVEDLVLVPVWAVRDHDQIRARFNASCEHDVFRAIGRVDLGVSVTHEGAGTLSLDGLSLTAQANGLPLPVSAQGVRVLEYLIRADRVVPPEELMTAVWGSSPARTGTTLRSLIHHVRRALPDGWSPCLATVRLRGYQWTDGD